MLIVQRCSFLPWRAARGRGFAKGCCQLTAPPLQPDAARCVAAASSRPAGSSSPRPPKTGSPRPSPQAASPADGQAHPCSPTRRKNWPTNSRPPADRSPRSPTSVSPAPRCTERDPRVDRQLPAKIQRCRPLKVTPSQNRAQPAGLPVSRWGSLAGGLPRVIDRAVEAKLAVDSRSHR
jgi:hypothetical protein